MSSPQPDVTLKQKTREGEAVFAFRPDRLDYDFADRKGTKVHRQIPWNVVPPRFRLKGRARMNGMLIRLSRGAAMLLIFVFCAQFRLFGLAPILAPAALVFFGLTVLFSREFRLEHAVLGTSAGNIVILGDHQRDEILEKIMQARRHFLGRFAAMDRQRTLRWNLQRLRWLTEQDVMTAEDFAKAQRTLLPGLVDTLLHRPPSMPDRRIEQRFCNALFAFDFKPDHLALEAMIEPDPLLSPEEQAGRYATLGNLGVLDAMRVPQLLARASALQAHLGLADPKPATAAAMTGEERPRESPQVTLH
jgi:hypothetical protein